MAQKNDQIFQLSLTEIAFTIAFILLLLLGYLVAKEQAEKIAAQDQLAKVQNAEKATAALDAAKNSLATALQGAGAPNPEEVITKLIAVEDVRAERDRLKQKVEDLDARLTALTELQNQLEKVAMASRPDIIKEEINSALALQEQVRKAFEQGPSDIKPVQPVPHQPEAKASLPNASSPSKEQRGSDANAELPASASKASKMDSGQNSSREQLNKNALERVKQAVTATGELKMQLKTQLDMDLKPDQIPQTVRDVVFAAKNYGELVKSGANPEVIKKENSDLRGQVAFLKNRLDARGGRDFPPCWADESGKVEFLFLVEMKPDSVVVTPAWPKRREAAAQALPGITEVLAGSHSNHNFVSSIQGVFNWSKKQDPECRFYVQLKSSISDAIQSDRARLVVENYFYKVELRR